MLSFTGKLYLIDLGGGHDDVFGIRNQVLRSGAPGYTAPEYYETGRLTPRSDLYSLGAIPSQLITGERPASRLSQFAPLDTENYSFPITLARLVLRLLHPDPQKRPEHAAAVRRELQIVSAAWRAEKGREP